MSQDNVTLSSRDARVLVLADFSNLAYRVTPTFSMAPYPMVRRALLRVRDVARAVGATDLAFAFDPDPALSPLFGGAPEEARTPVARRLLRELGYPCYQEPGVSADDLLIALARTAEGAGFGAVVIASHDMDLLAAVSPRTSLVRPMTAHGTFLRFDIWNAERIAKRFGIPIARLVDLRVLGCRPYLGTTHAILDGRSSRRLLARYGSLASIYAHLPEIEPAGLRDRLASQETFAGERLASIQAVAERVVAFDPDAGRLGVRGAHHPIDAGLEGFQRHSLLLAADGPRLASLASLALATSGAGG
jgi:hypothetical protein